MKTRYDVAYHINGATFWEPRYSEDENLDLEKELAAIQSAMLVAETITVKNGDKLAVVRTDRIDAVTISRYGKQS